MNEVKKVTKKQAQALGSAITTLYVAKRAIGDIINSAEALHCDKNLKEYFYWRERETSALARLAALGVTPI